MSWAFALHQCEVLQGRSDHSTLDTPSEHQRVLNSAKRQHDLTYIKCCAQAGFTAPDIWCSLLRENMCMQVDAHDPDRDRTRTFKVATKWTATVDVQELLDFVQ